MADTPEQTPKIDSLRAKVQADPKSRHFYPLAEELRKVGQLEEAEKVLRAGLVHHASYLSAWLSLGRVLKDRGAYSEAVDALMRGLSLDPENVVAAKLLANVHLAKGDKVEAIKKFKLVHALMPTDEEAEAQIDQLDRELNPQNYAPAPVPDDAVNDSTSPPFPEDEPLTAAATTGESVQQDDRAARFDHTNPDPFALGMDAMRPQEPEATEPELADEATPFGDAELPEVPEMPVVSPDVAPAGDPLASLSGPASLVRAPSSEDVWASEEESGTELPESAATVTMAQILVQQGDLVRARETYRRVLERDPGNVVARSGLEALEPRSDSRGGSGSGRVARLEAWRRKVAGS